MRTMSLYMLVVSLSNHEPDVPLVLDKLRTSGVQKRYTLRTSV